MELALILAGVFFAAAILLNVLQIIKTLLEIAKMILKPILWVVGNTISCILSPCFGR